MSNKPNFRDWNMDCKVYIGNLSETASKMDVENTFGKYGPLRNVWVARNPPGFAFVEYDDARDAEDAVRGLDGTKIGGSRVRVEMSHGRSRRGGHGAPRGYRGGQDRNGGGYSRGRDGGYGDRYVSCFSCDEQNVAVDATLDMTIVWSETVPNHQTEIIMLHVIIGSSLCFVPHIRLCRKSYHTFLFCYA